MKHMKKILALALALALAFALAVPAFAADVSIQIGPDGVTTGTFTVTLPGKPGNETPKTVQRDYVAYQIFSASYAQYVSGYTDSKPDKDGTVTRTPTYVTQNGEGNRAVQLYDIGWGTGLGDKDNIAAFLAALKAEESFKGAFSKATTATDVAVVVAGWMAQSETGANTDGRTTDARTFAAIAERFVVQANQILPQQTINAGYYLVVDVTSTEKLNGAPRNLSTLIMGDATGPFDPYVKVDIPELDKQVLEINDSNNNNPTWGDAADYDFGDHIPFVLTGTLPSDYDSYESYYYRFVDQMSGGLVMDKGSIHVYVDGSEVFNFQTVESSKEFTVYFTDLKTQVPQAESTSLIQVVYTASLSDRANLKIGDPGNLNTAWLVFSNDPTPTMGGTRPTPGPSGEPTPTPSGTPNPTPTPTPGGGDEPTPTPSETPNPTPTPPPGTGETPKDTATVFTYRIETDKINENGAALEGAQFTLYKAYNKDSLPEGLQNVEPITVSVAAEPGADSVERHFYPLVNLGTMPMAGTVSGEGDAKRVSYAFNGLDAGDYMLREDVVPVGYNKVEDMFFTVVAEPKGGASPHVESLSIKDNAVRDAAGNKVLDMKQQNGGSVSGKDLVFTSDKSEGSLSTKIVNLTGVLLPSTGGIGTTIFYVIGGLLVLAAVVLLITKKRMGNQDKPE